MKGRLLSDMVSNIITIISTDVVQVGIISNIHIRAANTKIAIVRCSTTVSPSIPKNEVGTSQRNKVTAMTRGSNIVSFLENFLSVPWEVV